MKRLTCVALAAAILAGCQSPPNTPGAGVGDKYTPVIDMQGVEPSQYHHDLNECRRYAGIVDAQGQAISGAIAGAVIMGIFAAALGGNSHTIDNSAAAGGFAGLSSATARATGKQERILINCMAGRGYKTLDGTVAPIVINNPAQPGTAPSNGAAALTAPAQLQTRTNTSSAANTQPSGQDAYSAQRLAKEQSCSTQPNAVLANKGPGFEHYSVACHNGDTLMIRCEFGTCRALR